MWNKRPLPAPFPHPAIDGIIATGKRCSSCPNRTKCVGASGPQTARVVILGEGPGRTELEKRIPFVGDSGSELDQVYLPLAGLDRDSVYVTNTTLCGFPDPAQEDKRNPYRNPTREEAMACARYHLNIQLAAVEPEVVVAMGGIANSIWQDEDGQPAPIPVAKYHGNPQWRRFGWWRGWVFPTYHPAAGLRQSQFMRAIAMDMEHLKDLLAGGFHPPEPYPKCTHTHYSTPAALTRHLQSTSTKEEVRKDGVGIDTEHDESTLDPYCLTFSTTPNTSGLILASGRPTLETFFRWLAETRPLVPFHAKLHDSKVLVKMGGPNPNEYEWEDTILKASVLQLPSIGLKPLALRYLHLHMDDYDEVVTPPSLLVLMRWAREAQGIYQAAYMHSHVFKAGKRKGQSEPRAVKGTSPTLKSAINLCNSLVRKGEELIGMGKALGMFPLLEEEAVWTSMPTDEDLAPPMSKLCARPKGWDPDKLAALEDLVMAPVPRRSIVHVPMPDLLPYAGNDAIATRALRPILTGMMDKILDDALGGKYA